MALAGMLTSCDYIEDTRQSMVLSGEWKGDFGMYYEYVDGYGQCYTFDSYDTRITFIPAYSYAHHGTGTQVDYYDYGPYEYQYYSFRWSVSDGIITLVYDYDHQLDTRIGDYHMTNDYLFKALLQKNERVLRGLICSLLHLKPDELRSTEIQNPFILSSQLFLSLQ